MVARSREDLIREMVEALNRIVEGDDSIRLEPPENDELIGALVDSINAIIDRSREKAGTRLGEGGTTVDSIDDYSSLFKSHPHPMWVYDLETLRFLQVNDAAVHHYGYSQEEFLQMTIKDIRPPEEIPALMNSLSHPSDAYEVSPGWRHRKKDGSVIRVEIISHPFRFGGRPAELILANDISSRLQAEESLMASEGRLRRAQKIAHVGNWELDLHTNALWGSEEAFRIYGIEQEDAGLPLHVAQEAVLPQYRKRLDDALLRLIRDNEEYEVDFEIWRVNDRGVRFLHSKAELMVDGSGVPVKVAGVIQDITKQKRDEEDKAKLEAQLIQAQKMESVGRLAGGIAHDFNNILSVILGYAELITSRLSPEDPLRTEMTEIETAAGRARDLTQQLLAFSRRQMIAPRSIDLNDLVGKARNTLGRLMGEDIELQFIPGDSLWMIRFDPTQIEQILMNLVVNARDAMPRGGKLTIRTGNIRLDESFCKDHPTSMPGDYVVFEVSDTGVGMDPETLSHAFEPFFTTKSTGRGTGLGLATVYGIVAQSRGFLDVESHQGLGTCFKIFIPRTVEGDAAVEGAPVAGIDRGSGTVLLVEDNVHVRGLTTAMLRAVGYGVLTPDTPQDAIALSRNESLPIDLLMTDVVMPGMNGGQLAERIKAIRPGIKVLFMSGFSPDIIVDRGVLKDGVEFIQKPFGLHALARKIRQVTGHGDL